MFLGYLCFYKQLKKRIGPALKAGRQQERVRENIMASIQGPVGKYISNVCSTTMLRSINIQHPVDWWQDATKIFREDFGTWVSYLSEKRHFLENLSSQDLLTVSFLRFQFWSMSTYMFWSKTYVFIYIAMYFFPNLNWYFWCRVCWKSTLWVFVILPKFYRYIL